VLLGGSLVKGVQSQGCENGGIAGSAGKQRQTTGSAKADFLTEGIPKNQWKKRVWCARFAISRLA
jgi:hypothetical protein